MCYVTPPMDGNGQASSWSVKKSQKLYQIRGWGEPYFKINALGHVEVRPDPTQDRGIDLYDLTTQLGERGLDLPLLIRFPNILQDRIRLLNECFENRDHESTSTRVSTAASFRSRSTSSGI